MLVQNFSFGTRISSIFYSNSTNFSRKIGQFSDFNSNHPQLRLQSDIRFFSDATIYSNRATCTLIPGDGPGIDLARSLQDIFFAAHVPVTFETVFFSELEPNKSVSLDKVVESILRNRLCVKGFLDLTNQKSVQNAKAKWRKALGLYGKIVHARSVPFLETRHKNIDIMICTEQVNGYSSVIEFEILKNVIGCSRIVNYDTYKEIVKYVFDYARKSHRKKITCVHKANIFKYSDGMFLNVGDEVSKSFSDINYEKIIVDNFCANLVAAPTEFDVVFTPNIYEDIITNIAAGLVGSSEYMTAVTFSKDCSIFEPVSMFRVFLFDVNSIFILNFSLVSIESFL